MKLKYLIALLLIMVSVVGTQAQQSGNLKSKPALAKVSQFSRDKDALESLKSSDDSIPNSPQGSKNSQISGKGKLAGVPRESAHSQKITVTIPKISFDGFTVDDVDLYGEIWAELRDEAGNVIQPQYNSDNLMSISGYQNLKREDLRIGYSPKKEVKFVVPPDNTISLTLFVFYNLYDRDEPSPFDDDYDDALYAREKGSYSVPNGERNNRLCIVIRLDEVPDRRSASFVNTFVDMDGDYPFNIHFTVTKIRE